MMEFTELEQHVVDEFRASNSLPKTVLEKFCGMKTEECRWACVRAMANVPRQPEVIEVVQKRRF